MKFAPYQDRKGSSMAMYDTVWEHILTLIKKTFKNGADVVKYIETNDMTNVGQN